MQERSSSAALCRTSCLQTSAAFSAHRRRSSTSSTICRQSKSRRRLILRLWMRLRQTPSTWNENGEAEIPREQIIGTASELFGDKVYADVEDQLASAVEEIQRNVDLTPNPKKDELKTLREQFSRPIADTLMDSARSAVWRRFEKVNSEPVGTQNTGNNRYRRNPRVRRLHDSGSSACQRARRRRSRGAAIRSHNGGDHAN